MAGSFFRGLGGGGGSEAEGNPSGDASLPTLLPLDEFNPAIAKNVHACSGSYHVPLRTLPSRSGTHKRTAYHGGWRERTVFAIWWQEGLPG